MPIRRVGRDTAHMAELRTHVDGTITPMSAAALSTAIHGGEVTCVEVMEAYLDRIDAVNPAHNAIVSLRDRDELLAEAAQCDGELAAGLSRGWMHGFPLAVKDLAETKGLRTTGGSPMLADQVPARDAIVVERMRGAGALVIGKTNVPEVGLGSHTYNPVFGTTLNAVDPTRSAGGSSGGGAVALALHMLPVADGSDYMGSLRNPPGWNGVVGFRPSQGRVPSLPLRDSYIATMGTEGPMGRDVLDTALLLGIQAGWDRRDPLSVAGRIEGFDTLETARRTLAPADPDVPLAGVRIGWLADLGGHLATEPGVLSTCEARLATWAAAGAEIVPIALPFSHDELWEAWVTWRQFGVSSGLGLLADLPRGRELLKPEILWEVDNGRRLTIPDLQRATVVRTKFFTAITSLLRSGHLGSGCDVLALPSAQTWPFPAEWHWPREIAGRTMDTYHRWMEVTIHATFAGLPCACVPAGVGAEGLPMGIQLIGGPLDDVDTLRIAAACELAAS